MEPKQFPDNPRYLVYPDGRIWDRNPKRGTPRFIAQNNVEGYKTVTIIKDGWRKTMWLHRILAELFVEKPPGAYLVRHLNDVRSDFRLENLKWGTLEDNWEDRKRNGNGEGVKGEKNWAAKITEEDVIDMRILHKFGASYSKLGAAFGISQGNVGKICSGQRWKHVKEGL